MNFTITPDSLETTDMYMAAWMLTTDAEFIGMRREANRAFFQFKTQDGERLKLEWIVGSAMVNAVAFTSAIMRLKGLLHSR